MIAMGIGISMKFWHATNKLKADIELNTVCTALYDISEYWKNKHTAESNLYDATTCSLFVKAFVNVGIDIKTAQEAAHLLPKTRYYMDSQKEYIFEEIRVTEFPDRPSRRNCMFLLPYQADISGFIEKYKFYNRINLEIETEDGGLLHFADASLLDCDTKIFSKKQDAARQYWSGTDKRDINTEVLFRGNYKIIRIND